LINKNLLFYMAEIIIFVYSGSGYQSNPIHK